VLDANISNYVTRTSNQVANAILDTSNNVVTSSNVISNRVTILDANISNYVTRASNLLANAILITSNNVVTSSNVISNRVTILDANISNYVTRASNQLANAILITSNNVVTNSNVISNRVTILDANISNYVTRASNQLANAILITSNNVVTSSNVISNRVTVLDANISNYVTRTSNQLANAILITSNNVVTSSNVISNRVTILDANISNYVTRASNQLANAILDTSNNIIDYIKINSSSSSSSSSSVSQWISSNNILFYIAGSNVGIGTINPVDELHLHNTRTFQSVGIRLTDATTGATSNDGILIEKDTSSNLKLWNYENAHIIFGTSNQEKMRILANGNIGIGTNNASAPLTIYTNATSITPSNNALYVYNPNNTANNCSVISARIGGSSANKALYSLDVNGLYGWSMYINGADTTDKYLRLNNSLDGTGTDRFIIRGSDGNVGIGTNSANFLLHVHGDINFTGTLRKNGSAFSGSRWSLTGNDIYYNTGNVGIGTNAITSTNSLEVYGNILLSNGGSLRATGDIIVAYSDIRLKTIVDKIKNPLDKITKISTFKYVPNKLAESFNINSNVQIGVSAQDVMKVCPEVIRLAPFDSSNLNSGQEISISGENYLTVCYERLVPLLIEGIKELKYRNDKLTKKYKKLHKKIQILEKK
jgi:hypothetical protein